MLGEKYRKEGLASRDTGVQWEGFARLPYRLVFHPEIQLSDLRVFAALHRHLGQRRRVWVGVTLLAQEAGLHPVTVKESLSRLRRLGFVAVEGRTSKRRVNIYLLSLDGDRPGGGEPVDVAEMQTALNVQATTADNGPSDLAFASPGNDGQGSLQITLEGQEKAPEGQTETALEISTNRQVSSQPDFFDGSLQATMTGGEGSLQATMTPSGNVAETQTGTPQNETGGCSERELRSIEREKERSACGKAEIPESLQLGGGVGGWIPLTESPGSQHPQPGEGIRMDWRAFFKDPGRKPTGKPNPKTIQAQIVAAEADLQAIEADLTKLREGLRTAHPSMRDAIEKEIAYLEAERNARLLQLSRLRAELANAVNAAPTPDVAKPKAPSKPNDVPGFVAESQDLGLNQLLAEIAAQETHLRGLTTQLEALQTRLNSASPSEKAALETEMADLQSEISATKNRIGVLRMRLAAYELPKIGFRRLRVQSTRYSTAAVAGG